MISEKHKAVFQLIAKYESLVKDSESNQKKVSDLHRHLSSLSKDQEKLVEENRLLKEKEHRLFEKERELIEEREKNRKLQAELASTQQPKENRPSPASSHLSEAALTEHRLALEEKEQELEKLHRHFATECKRRESERDDLMHTLAETANQLHRQLASIRELKEEILRLQSELARTNSDKEAHVEEIARLKTKLHELTLFLEKNKGPSLASDEIEKARHLRSHLETALSLLTQKEEGR